MVHEGVQWEVPFKVKDGRLASETLVHQKEADSQGRLAMAMATLSQWLVGQTCK